MTEFLLHYCKNVAVQMEALFFTAHDQWQFSLIKPLTESRSYFYGFFLREKNELTSL